MSQFNELGIDVSQMRKLARTDLIRINGHTSLWQFEEREAEPEAEQLSGDEVQTLHKNSYYGNVTLGSAAASEYQDMGFAVAVAFTVDSKLPEAAGLSNTHLVTAIQLNPPQIFLTTQEYALFKKRVIRARPQPQQARVKATPADITILPWARSFDGFQDDMDFDTFGVLEPHPVFGRLATADSDSIVVCSSCAYAYRSAKLEDGLCDACTNDPEFLEPWCEACEQYHDDDH
jgi:hypothetical protein